MGLSRRQLLKSAVGFTTCLASRSWHSAPNALAGGPSLRVLADRLGLNLGTAIGVGGFKYPDFRDQLNVVKDREFNFGSAWVNWGTIEPTKGARNFGWLDYQLSEAERLGHKVFGYNLVNPDPRQLPGWVQGITSKTELAAALSSVVFDTLSHSRGRVYAWNILCESQNTHGDVFQSLIGPEYVEIAFEAARRADPAALLSYADYGNHVAFGTRYGITKAIVDRLKPAGLVDMVGIECAGIPAQSAPTHDMLVSGFQSYGIPVIVTELAVLLHSVDGAQAARYERQAEVYSTFMNAALDSGVCHDFLFEAVVDKLSIWETAQLLPSVYADNDPTLFDDNFQPKPAYYSVALALQQAGDAKFKYRARLPMLSLDR